MNNNEISAGTKDEQRTDADLSTSASVAANPMLCVVVVLIDVAAMKNYCSAVLFFEAAEHVFFKIMINKKLLSKIEVGNKLLVKIIDSPPDGDGSIVFYGIDEVWFINELGNFCMFNCKLFAMPNEVVRVYLKKHQK